MKEGQKYLTVYLRSGLTFDVEGETLQEFPKPVPDSFGEPWHMCKTPYGRSVKISANEIAAISENQFILEPFPW